VSLHGTVAEWQFPFRDTGNFAEKGVSLHRASVFPVSGCRDTGFSS
jgi:hypothetical protein